MGKAIIAPLVGLVVIVLQLVFGVEVPEDVVNEFIVSIGNAVAVILVVIGLVQNKLKKKKTSIPGNEAK